MTECKFNKYLVGRVPCRCSVLIQKKITRSYVLKKGGVVYQSNLKVIRKSDGTVINVEG